MQDDSYDEMPDWLREMRPPMEEERGKAAEPPVAPFGPLPRPPSEREPVLDELREQAFGARLREVTPRSRAGLGGMIQGLAPWQRFVLALLLFLDVALLGCMCLVMTGRVAPF